MESVNKFQSIIILLMVDLGILLGLMGDCSGICRISNHAIFNGDAILSIFTNSIKRYIKIV